MVTPIILPRAEHTISRAQIDPDALKVLTRLRQFNHVAYLVGGSVRDLLLGRRPKDFDIGTSAHPQEVKRMFRNCWIIGRRFRLAHVKFGTKTIEVATFRRLLSEEEIAEHEAAAPRPPRKPRRPSPAGATAIAPCPATTPSARPNRTRSAATSRSTRSSTTSRRSRSSTTRAASTDLKAQVIRSIGDPNVRFGEDPVRMLRAIVLAARLDFSVDPLVVEAIRRHAHLIGKAAPARLLEEFYKILRSGASERAFRELAEVGLLDHLAPELVRDRGQALWPYTRVARRVSPPVRERSRYADQSGAAWHAAGAAGLHRGASPAAL